MVLVVVSWWLVGGGWLWYINMLIFSTSRHSYRINMTLLRTPVKVSVWSEARRRSAFDGGKPFFRQFWRASLIKKNPAYGRQTISRPMQIVGPIQFWRGFLIYLRIFFLNILQNLWNNFPPKSVNLFFSKIFETIFLQNLWDDFPPKSLKQISSKIFETIFLQSLWKIFLQNL